MSDGTSQASGSCTNCGAELSGPWCSQCGEQVRKPGDLSLKAYLGEMVEALTNLEGRFWGSLRTLVFKPGLLSQDYLAGRRMRWMRPLHLFLLINLLYFFFSSWNTFTTELHWHIGAEGFLHQPVASRLINAEINQPPLAHEDWAQIKRSFFVADVDLSSQQQIDRERLRDYGRLFNSRIEVYSRTLIILMIPLMTLAPLLMLALRRETPIAHLILATHWTAFFLLASLVSGWLIDTALILGWLRPDGRLVDLLGTLALLGLAFAWTLPAARRVYRLGWIKAILFALIMSAWLIPALMIYRAILFFLVFWSL